MILSLYNIIYILVVFSDLHTFFKKLFDYQPKIYIYVAYSRYDKYKKIEVPSKLKQDPAQPVSGNETPAFINNATVDTRSRKNLNAFWDKFKDGIIDLFKEEGDAEIK